MEWYIAFALTLAIELPVVGLLCPRGARRRGVKDAAAANLLTHPCAWWAILSAGMSWWLVEGLVWLAEACVYRAATRLSWTRAATTSLVANGVTAALGWLL